MHCGIVDYTTVKMRDFCPSKTSRCQDILGLAKQCFGNGLPDLCFAAEKNDMEMLRKEKQTGKLTARTSWLSETCVSVRLCLGFLLLLASVTRCLSPASVTLTFSLSPSTLKTTPQTFCACLLPPVQSA